MLLGAATKGNITPSDSFFSSHNIQGFAGSDKEDGLAVRVLALKDDDHLFLILGFEAGDAPGIVFKERLAFRYGIRTEDILTYGLHNHGLYWGRREKPIAGKIPPASESELEYEKQVYSVTIETIDRAIASFEEVLVRFESGNCSSLINRVDSSIPAINAMDLLEVVNKNGEQIAVMASIPCHEMFPHERKTQDEKLWVNSGIPGKLIGDLRKDHPETLFALACAAGADQRAKDDLQSAGDIAEGIRQLLNTVGEVSNGALKNINTVLWLNGSVPLKIQMFLVGDIAILGVAGELYADIGRKIKEISPFEKTMIITSTDRDHAGYIVSDRFFDQKTFMTKDIATPGDLEETIYSGLKRMWEAREWEH